MEFFLSLLLVLIVGAYVVAGWSLAPWVPTLGRDLERVIRLVGDIAISGKFIEIGSGDGRVTRAVARAYPNLSCLGIEYFWLIWLWSRIVLLFSPIPNASFALGNFYRRNISDADVLFCFGHPDTLKEKFISKLSECKPHTKLISYVFAIEGLVPDLVDREEKRFPIYVYTVGVGSMRFAQEWKSV